MKNFTDVKIGFISGFLVGAPGLPLVQLKKIVSIALSVISFFLFLTPTYQFSGLIPLVFLLFLIIVDEPRLVFKRYFGLMVSSFLILTAAIVFSISAEWILVKYGIGLFVFFVFFVFPSYLVFLVGTCEDLFWVLTISCGFHILVYLENLFIYFSSLPVVQFKKLTLVPVVGRKYLSMSLTTLIPPLIYKISCSHSLMRFLPYLFWLMLVIATLSLATIDTRGAYFSIIFGLIFICLSRNIRLSLYSSLKKFLYSVSNFRVKIGFAFLSIAFLSLVYVFSVPRLLEAGSAISAATLERDSHMAWVEPSKWDSEFHSSDSDQSIYLRLSWFVFGVESILNNPLGIGLNPNPLQVLLSQKYPLNKENLYADFHSEVLSLAVCLGLASILAIILGLFFIMFKLKSKITRDHSSQFLILLTYIMGVWLGRSFVDSLSDGLWYAFMAIFGIVLGAFNNQPEFKKKSVSQS